MMLQSDLWAKTDENGEPVLSVLEHCMHVGAVAETLLSSLPASTKSLVPDGAATMIAAHDIGKISPGFQLKSLAWKNKWQSPLGLLAPDSYEPNHAKTSHHALARAYGHGRPLLWLISINGHHGHYACTRCRIRLRGGHLNDPDWAVHARQSLLEELVRRFGMLTQTNVEKGARLHWYTGLMIFSDWVGSSTEWFPHILKATESGNETAARAKEAIHQIGWSRRNIRPRLKFPDMFSDGSKSVFQPRPVQQALLECANEPGLYIVEAPTGCGKTEAALAAAYKRWSEGEEAGLYFALPTQLTSNRIHERVGDFLRNVLADASSIARIHSNAWLMGDRVEPIFPNAEGARGKEYDAYGWFSDNRKALLAPFGAGTVDQALMAAMPVKFSALRLFALSGKIIVIDEVHSYDPYTSALVDQAVRWLLECGCTIFILSATLTAKRRSSLVQAAGAKEPVPSDAYPLITKVSTRDYSIATIPVETNDTPQKTIEIKHKDRDRDEWLNLAAKAAENGACVLIVRNTIALAQETFRRVKAECNASVEHFGLLHSRFPQYRREEMEEDWMGKLGKDAHSRPKGAILVGTQVVEQSVDIDADLLITDLAPTDLILQRIGRLHRHDRERPAEFKNPVCVILQPDVEWDKAPKTIKETLGPMSYVYPPFTLYQAQRNWRERDQIILPSEIRRILEDSSETPADLPQGAEELRIEQENKTKSMLARAKAQSLFSIATEVGDLEGHQTRWGSMRTTRVVLLAKTPEDTGNKTTLHFKNGESCECVRGVFNYRLSKHLQANAIKTPAYLMEGLREATPEWVALHTPDAVLMVNTEDSTRCEPVHSADTAQYAFTYHPEIGLEYQRLGGDYTSQNEDEYDSWF